MGTFWHYFNEVEALAARWRGMSVTPDRCAVISKVSKQKGVPPSESEPEIAECGPLQYVMKPSKKKSDEKYRAALEKIASDLGCDLGIAVTPVILWERGSGISETEDRYVYLAAWAFKPVHTWEEAEAVPGKIECEKGAVDICAAWPFQTWIATKDRGGKHPLISLPNSGNIRQTANIDYAFSMLDSCPNVSSSNWSVTKFSGISCQPQRWCTANPAGAIMNVLSDNFIGKQPALAVKLAHHRPFESSSD